jgi:hypothetical protein
VPNTTNVVKSNPVQASCARYNIMWYNMSAICGWSVVFSAYFGVHHQKIWPPRYSWNIVESGGKRHNPSHGPLLSIIYGFLLPFFPQKLTWFKYRLPHVKPNCCPFQRSCLHTLFLIKSVLFNLIFMNNKPHRWCSG